jgi:hypothetical protein
MIEPPSRAVRDYLAGFDLGCILVRPAGEVQVSRNWGRAPVAAALWAQDWKTAWQVVQAIGEAQPSSVEAAVIELKAAAVRLNVVLSEHSIVVARASAALGRLGSRLELARRDGTLKFFNSEYQRRRKIARSAGVGFMNYSTATGRLERAKQMNTNERYWIALNGSSCALSSLPMQNPLLTPTPEQLIGFPTWEEAEDAQRICLQASMDVIRGFFAGLRPHVGSGRIRVIRPAHPQPPTSGPTMWTESTEVHTVAQAAFVKMTAN